MTCDFLADLAYTFTIIGLSETKIKHHVDQISNMDCYQAMIFYHNQPWAMRRSRFICKVMQGLQYHIVV